MQLKTFSRQIIAVLVLLMGGVYNALAQADLPLTAGNVLEIVRRFHPVALQADLKVDSARAARLAARGAFDPLAFVENEQKTFAGTNYYYYTQAGLKIPTWYGIDVKAGIENNGGNRLLSEVTSGKTGYAGISMPLLKGLAIDNRRAALLQANIIIQQSEAERRNAINDLLYDAAGAYWQWVRDYRVYQVITRATEINQRRFSLIKRSFAGGDRAAIDTTEALTQLQNFLWLQSEAFYDLQNAALSLSNYLWLPGNIPYNLPAEVLPDSTWMQAEVLSYPLPVLDDLLVTARQMHPKLRSLAFKRDVLAVERRLKFQSLLPSLKVNYNFLSKGYEPWKGIGQNFLQNNYKYGFEFSVPLFLREARGSLKLADIKIANVALQQSQAALEIENKVKNYFAQVLALRNQVTIYEDAVQNYERLLIAEELKFSIGESSLFLLNNRENKLLEAQQKLIELKTKFFKALIALQWAAGILQ